MPKQQIMSDKISRPSGHFSHATMVEAKGRIVFISGMTAKKADGTMAGIGDPEAQTRQVCENLKAAVEAAGGTMADICRVDVYIRNMEYFDKIHKARRDYFPAPPPASPLGATIRPTIPWAICRVTVAVAFLAATSEKTRLANSLAAAGPASLTQGAIKPAATPPVTAVQTKPRTK